VQGFAGPEGEAGDREVLGGRLTAIGTSRSAGGLPTALITGPRQLADRFPSKLAGLLGLAENMLATSGSVLCHDETTPTMGGGGWAELFHKIVRQKPNDHQQGGAPAGSGEMALDHPDRVCTICDWINDQALVNGDPADANPATRYNGNRTTAKTQDIMRHGMRTLISLVQASRILEPNHTGVGEITYGGTASSHVAVSYAAGARERPHRGAVSGPGGYRSMPNGAWLEITTKPDYPGSLEAPLCAVFAADYNTTAGTIAVLVDGVAVPEKTTVISRGSADSWSTNPRAIRFRAGDIPAGAHTIRFTVTGLTGNPARFQRFWYEANDESVPDVLCYETVNMNPTPSVLFPQNSAADFQLYNDMLRDLIDLEFRDNVHYVPIDSLAGDRTGALREDKLPYFTDTMHHTELGHAEYAMQGYLKVTGTIEKPDLRRKARRARANVQDFRASLSFSAAISLPDSTAVLVPWNRENVDTSGLHADQTQLERLTVPTDGVWDATFGAGFSAEVTTGIRMMWIVLFDAAGSPKDQSPGVVVPTANTSVFFVPSGIVHWPNVVARAGDYFVAHAIQTSGATRTLLASGPFPRFDIIKRGEV
jgi:hypothetical protein